MSVRQSSIYPPGTEYALCGVMAQLMGAVVAELSGSLTETLKGFYKLRKAYSALEGIIASEKSFMDAQTTTTLRASTFNTISSNDTTKGTLMDTSGSSKPTDRIAIEKPNFQTVPPSAEPKSKSLDDNDEDEFQDAEEALKDDLEVQNSKEIDNVIRMMEEPLRTSTSPQGSLNGRVTSEFGGGQPAPMTKMLTLDPNSAIFNNNVDAFVHSGSNLCYGVLLLIISLVPPVFTKLLYIVGFRGDRQRGLRMLWQSSKFRNINGAMAGVVLLAY